MAENIEYIIDLTSVEEPIEMISGDLIIDSDKYIEKNIINAKGDLIVGSEEAEPMRLPIGSPNYFMVVDPTQDRGYKFTNEIDGGTF
ncbi:MAG: hypothetical protein AB1432_01565 [Bacteroidota bacterium]